MSTFNPQANESFFALLPEELYLAIIDHLPMPSIIALSQTNRLFNRVANLTSDLKRPQLNAFLISAQASPRWRGDGFACFVCTKVLPRRRFSDDHTKDERGRDGAEQTERFCVPCGLKTGRLEKGSEVWRGTTRMVVCWGCGVMKGRGQAGGISEVCRDCDRDQGVFEAGEREGFPRSRET
jgi:hypothetical protein